MFKRPFSKYPIIVLALLATAISAFVVYARVSVGSELNLPIFIASIGADEYHPGNSAALHELRDSMARYDSLRLRDIALQDKEIRYYMRTHNVIDNGFDIIARYDVALKAERDSLLRADSVYSCIWSKEWVQRIADPRLNPADPLPGPPPSEGEGVNTPKGLSTRWPLFLENYLSAQSSINPPAKIELSTPSPSDGGGPGWGSAGSAGRGSYLGDTDPWGVPSGFGIDITPGQRMRVGEWRDGKYLGERITYTADRIYGIDISRYQHEQGRKRFSIDWSNLAITSLGKISKKRIEGNVDYPISFIYIKSTEGTNIRNRYFAADYAASRKHGYKTGAYHFFSTKSGGGAQAKFFLNVAKYQKGDFPPVLDVEPSHAQIVKMGGVAKMFHEIRVWLHHVEMAWHVKPVLYISQSFVNRYLPSAPDLMKSYDVWIARYGEYKPDVNLVYWQLSPDGRVRGIKTEVDINVFNGFQKEFEEYNQ